VTATRPAGAQRHPRQHGWRLRVWPDLPLHQRTAPVLRTLSRMSCGPVSHQWVLDHCKLPPAEAEQLLDRLLEQDCVQLLELEHAD
jgi:hypothetical protein